MKHFLLEVSLALLLELSGVDSHMQAACDLQEIINRQLRELITFSVSIGGQDNGLL